MYGIVVGGGVKGVGILQDMQAMGWEVVLIEKDKRRFLELEGELEHMVINADGSDLAALKSVGVARADVVVAATESDATNIVISQIAQEFNVDLVLPLVNDPDYKEHFEALGFDNPISVSEVVLSRINHALPHTSIVPLLDMKSENLEILEITITEQMPCSGKMVRDLDLPVGARLVSTMRDGKAHVVTGDTIIMNGDRALLVLEPEYEEESLRILCAEQPLKRRRKKKR